MGLIRAGRGALGGILADQWKEFFYCDSMGKDVLVTKGQKRITGRSTNTKGNDNIISNGSGIAVADGQCMLIVEQGKIVEFCAESGEFTYDTSTEPSIFSGNLGDSVKQTFKVIGKRFTFGGDTAKDQRVYYINTKEMGEIDWSRPAVEIERLVRGMNSWPSAYTHWKENGNFTYRICDPLLFYTNVCGNVEQDYESSEISGRLKGELMTALQPALSTLSAKKVQYYEIPAHTQDLSDALNEVLSKTWKEKRGIEVFSFNINSLSIPEDQRKKINEWEENAMTTNPTTAAARLVGGQIDAMKAAAGNNAGAMTGFMGMGMAMNAGGMGGMNAQNLFAMGQQQPQAAPQQTAPEQSQGDTWICSCGTTVNGKFCPECGSKKPEPKMEPAGSWKCKCGATATGKFCSECGSPKPADSEGWICSCGTVNKGKFCQNCGAKKPQGALLYRCDKCGWEPEDPAHPPKFCPECGDPFDDADRTN